ncbi:MAG TPA: hypothetical protein H9779_02685 [Candidatus Alistipes avicola]|uniref:Long-chain fatty acid transport protein n=1 Tax=Candidatus Alistipes avicola TaxID=2838432 RepID=A0A9D2IE81_9BACT|nr:hypothetical protein [uncultured Alistipes sp.]HJA98492.1 hypothetical protein [Candidatus Alistipes avicola]
MQVKRAVVKLGLVLAMIIPCAAWGQSSSTNAFSPYSMYGLGELQTPGTLRTRSMGGVGIGMRSTSSINLLNPASYSVVRPKSFVFDFGVEGQCFYNAQKYGGQTLKTSNYTFNFHDIAFQMPLARRVGLGFSLTPYSSVGYRMKHEETSDDIWGNIGRVQYQWEGDGDVTEVKLGVGWEIIPGLSIGAALQYYWGDIDRTYKTAILENIVGGDQIASASGVENYSISRLKGQFGLQWSPIYNRRRILTIGATYDIGGNLNPKVTKSVTTGDVITSVAKGDTVRLDLKLPRQIAVGIYYTTPKIAVGADYVYQNWRGSNSRIVERAAGGFDVAYRNTSTFKVGVEYTPNRGDIRSVLKRWSYRAGVRYGTFNQTFGGLNVNEYAVTLGVGIPLRIMGSSAIDLGVELGQRGSFDRINEQIGLVKQTYFKFSIGITMFGEDYWFVRPKYD